MPLYIKDRETAELVAELAERLKTTKQDAVKSAVKAELDRMTGMSTFRDKFEAFYERFPLPEPTGETADKAFFDELSGDVD